MRVRSFFMAMFAMVGVAFAADTLTSNYSFVKPEIGGSTTTWGNKLNSNLDQIDSQIKSRQTEAAAAQATANAALPKAGGTMTGAINMGAQLVSNAANPSSAQDLTTKFYVDAGTSTLTTSINNVNTIATAALPKAGGTMTGAINHGGFVASNVGTPSATTDATTKAYVDAAIAAAVAGVPTAPSVPSGAVMAFNLSSCPSGWLAADGTAYALDLRGEFIRGWSNGRSVDTGRTLASLQSDLVKDHTHAGAGGSGAQMNSAFGANGYYMFPSQTTGNMTSGGGTETRPRNVALLYCVKS